MITRRTTRADAVALLEAADPVEPRSVDDELDPHSARERLARLIAADGTTAFPASPRRRPRVGRRLTAATVAVLAAAAVAVVAVEGGSPAVPVALANPVRAALRALRAPSGAILHINYTQTQVMLGTHHAVYSSHYGLYEQTVWPYTSLTIDEHMPKTPPGAEGINGATSGEQIYDPMNDTIYAPPAPKPAPGSTPANKAQLAALYQPYMGRFISQLRSQLASGAARVAGRAVVDGRTAIRIQFAGSDEVDYVAAGTYIPIKTIQGTPDGPTGRITIVFHVFEYLPASSGARLLSLTIQHPTAHVDRNLADFRSAIARVYQLG